MMVFIPSTSISFPIKFLPSTRLFSASSLCGLSWPIWGRKDHHGRSSHLGASVESRWKRVLIVAPGSLVEQ
jgi:hypothetical protein